MGQISKSKRHLTVYYSTGCNINHPTPQILIQGKWVEEAGFAIGDGIDLSIREGEIIVRRAPRPVEAPRRPQRARLDDGTYIWV